jgi:CRISPR system Cascade subunit CasC
MNMPSRFLQIHFLTSYPSALLNRDDAGFAKRVPFGGASRTRISSQCLKSHWRRQDGDHALSAIGELSIRSRRTFEQELYQPLAREFPPPLAQAVTQAVISQVLGKSEKAKKSEEEGSDSLRTAQVTVMGRPELRYLLDVARKVCTANPDPKKASAELLEQLGREGRKNLEALKRASGLDAALFGRMVTSDILARGDAAVHVAHAFTVHPEYTESDYFSAVDSLQPTGEEDQALGSGHIGSVELTSGLYYGYVVVDLPLLVRNLEAGQDWRSADRDLAARVVESLVHVVATVSPGAKLGSTAPYAYAQMVMVEAGSAQPRTLANAFLKPVTARDDLMGRTYDALGAYLTEIDAAFGAPSRRYLALGAPAAFKPQGERIAALAALATWAGNVVRGDE